jgi:6-pyruvoyltetrahydropterin/6-carboxytetrahydropterin synthase
MTKFQSTKILDGYSICFRPGSTYSSKTIYGGAISFRLFFEGEVDHRNWVVDFGFLKRSKYKVENIKDALDNELEPMFAKDYFNWLFDHTLIFSENDPYLLKMKFLNSQSNIAQLRILPDATIQGFTKHVYDIISNIISNEHSDRIKLVKIIGNLQSKESYTYEGQ